MAYAPYGEDYADSGTADLDFTGQNQDTVSGLYDFMYREYHPNSGRWIQPDPAGLAASDPSNPQSWNRYAYVANNPISAVDPVGLMCSDVVGGGCESDFFLSQLGAWNQNIDFSFDSWVKWNNHQTFGDQYNNLPGHTNNIQQGLEYTDYVDDNSAPIGIEGYTPDDHSAYNARGLRLEVHSDCSRKGYRRIVYEITGPSPGDWYVTEHVNPKNWAPPNGTSTDPAAGQFDDTIYGLQIGRAFQTFTISRQNPTKYPGTPSIPIIVGLGGAELWNVGYLARWYERNAVRPRKFQRMGPFIRE